MAKAAQPAGRKAEAIVRAEAAEAAETTWRQQ